MPARPPGFWWRVLSPIGAVLAAFALLVAGFGALDAAGVGEDANAAILAFATSLLLLLFGVAILRRLPAHERRVAVGDRGRRRRAILFGFGLGLALLVGAAIIVATGAAIDPVVERRVEEAGDDLETSSAWQLTLLVIALVVLAPLGEELLFRGLLLRGLVRRIRFWPAAIVSGALFAAAHADSYVIWPRSISLVLTGIALAWIYRRRGYWASVTAHATVNGVAATFLVITSTT